MSRSLPLDLIIEILCRLPVKALLRFKSISKSSSSLTEDPNFIKFHLNHAIKTNCNNNLIISGDTHQHTMICSVEMDLLNKAVELDHPFKYCERITTVVGSCNGIVALYNGMVGTALWNPSTKKHLILPRLCDSFYASDDYFGGFGYDNANDDYKMIRMEKCYSRECCEASIYSLKTNSWKRIKNIPYYYNVNWRKVGAHVHSALHWPVRRVSDYEVLIIAFDLESESFHDVPLPNTTNSALVTVHVLGGSLCVCMKRGVEEDVWVMKEYGTKESWTKLFSSSIYRGCITNVINMPYSRASDKVLFVRNASDFYWYNQENDKVEDLQIQGKPEYFSNAEICMSSIVSLNTDTRIV